MNEIRELESAIQKADQQYYNGIPELLDTEYDGLRAMLKELDPDNVVLNRVGAVVTGEYKKVTHPEKMLSLNDVFNIDDIMGFCIKHPFNEFVAEMKLDGLAIELEYTNGKLFRASTRGDGTIGDDVTHSVKTIKNVPLILDSNVDLIVRGEVVIPKDKFILLNGFANARNAAAGSVRQKDSRVAAQRHLAFYAYSLINSHEIYHVEALNKLKEYGFEVVKQKLCKNPEDVINVFKSLEKQRKSLNIDIDGMVIKIDDKMDCDNLGQVGRYPRWAIACKFEPPAAITKLIRIELQKGRTGNITPVAILEPVNIAGSTITRASLHNQSEISRKGLYIGAMVVVEKAGDIIPEVIKVVSENKDAVATYCMPDTCLACGEILDKTYLNWRCLNEDCNIEKKVEYFVSKRCMDIQGLGPKLIEQLVYSGLVESFVDIFKFKDKEFCNQVMRLHGWSYGRIVKILKSMKQKEVITADKFYISLGIPSIGEMKSQEIAEIYPDVYEFIVDWGINDLHRLQVIGDVCYSNLCKWLNSNIQLVTKFHDNVSIINSVQATTQLTFLFTGKLSAPRAQFERKVLDVGHKVAKSVSKNIDYLVVGEKAGSKLDKAYALNIDVISEIQFNEVINER